MREQLQAVALSYDKAIDLGRKGIDLYKNLPEYITSDPDYLAYEAAVFDARDSGSSDDKEIIAFLSPQAGMHFVDLGCCLNLMFRGYDRWPSTYHGVDISPKTIQLLREFVAKKNLSIGSLHCCSVHNTPFEPNAFDIAACIGVLEYFERAFVEVVIAEAHRIIKPGGKFVLDIPNVGNPACRIMMLIEEYMGRPDKFNMPVQEFDYILQNHFEINRMAMRGSKSMIRYFLKCK